MSHASQHWQRPDDQESTWVDEVIENEQQQKYAIQELMDEQAAGLRAIVGAKEMSRTPPIEQITPRNANRGKGTLGRYLAFMHADPVRTNVLRFMAIESTVRWLRQHYPPERLASMKAAGYSQSARANVIGIDLHIDIEANRRCLFALHPGQEERINELLATITPEEIEALRRAIGWSLSEPPTPWVRPKLW